MKRWLRRILVAVALVAVLLLAVWIGVGIVLRGDTPRRIVAAQLEKQTGLRVSIGSMQTGWGGRSVLRDVTLSLPLSDEPLLEAPRIDATHASLLSLAISRNADIRELRIERASVRVAQDTSGRWNLQELVEALARARARNTAEGGGGAKKLPRVVIEHGEVRVSDRYGRSLGFPDASLTGESKGAGAWAFDAALDAGARARGEVLVGGDFHHQLDFAFDDLGPRLRPWIGEVDRFRVAGTWDGRIKEGVLYGRVDLREASSQGFTASGPSGLVADHGKFTATPERILVRADRFPQAAATLVDGTLELDDDRFRAEAVRVEAFGGDALVSARGDWRRRTGEADARWANLTLPGGFRLTGSAHATSGLDLGGERTLSAQLDAGGTAPLGSWSAKLRGDGHGPHLAAMTWQLAADRLALTYAGTEYALTDATARLDSLDNLLRFHDFHAAGPAVVTGDGQLDRRTWEWGLALAAENLQSTYLTEATLSASLRLAGNRQRVDLLESTILHPRFGAKAKGAYVFAGAKPLELVVSLNSQPVAVGTQPAEPDYPAYEALGGEIKLVGTLAPLRLEVEGVVAGEKTRWGGIDLGRVAGPLTGVVEPGVTTFDWRDLEMLEGKWWVHGEYREKSRVAKLHVNANAFQLRYLNSLFPSADAAGEMDLDLDATLPRWRVRDLTAAGSWSLHHAAIQGYAANEVRGKLGYRDTTLTLDEIEAALGEGRASGKVSLNVREPSRVRVEVKPIAWPVERPDQPIAARLSGEVDLVLDVKARDGRGRFDLLNSLSYQGRPTGDARLVGEMRGRVIEIERLTADVLKGHAEGSGTLVLADTAAAGGSKETGAPGGMGALDYTRTAGQITWKDLDASAVASLLPGLPWLDDLHGLFSGKVVMQPDASRDALGPSRVTAEFTGEDAHFRDVKVGGGRIAVFLGPDRQVLERCELGIADGTLSIFARAAARPEEEFYYARAQFDRLDLKQIEAAWSRDDKPVLGRVGGEAMLTWPRRRGEGLFGNYGRVFGQATVRLTESDLAHVGVFSMLYNAMNAQGGDQADGRGEVRLRVEGPAVVIEGMQYFNRGVDARIPSGRLADFRLGKESPINVLVIGTARLLPQISLFKEMDEALDALQSGVTALRITGTLGEMKRDLVPFEELRSNLRDILASEQTKHKK